MKNISKKFLSSIMGILLAPGVLLNIGCFQTSAKTVTTQQATSSLSDSKKLLNAFDEVYNKGWQTDHLIIESIKGSDVDSLTKQFFDEDVTKYYFNKDNNTAICENFKFANINQARDFIISRHTNSFFNSFLSRYRDVSIDNLCGDKDFVIRLKGSNEAIGILGYDVDLKNGDIELGINYFIGKKYQGSGYAKEATVELTKKILDNVTQYTFITTIHKDHKASQRVINLIFDNILNHDKSHKYLKDSNSINNLIKYTLKKSA